MLRFDTLALLGACASWQAGDLPASPQPDCLILGSIRCHEGGLNVFQARLLGQGATLDFSHRTTAGGKAITLDKRDVPEGCQDFGPHIKSDLFNYAPERPLGTLFMERLFLNELDRGLADAIQHVQPWLKPGGQLIAEWPQDMGIFRASQSDGRQEIHALREAHPFRQFVALPPCPTIAGLGHFFGFFVQCAAKLWEKPQLDEGDYRFHFVAEGMRDDLCAYHLLGAQLHLGWGEDQVVLEAGGAVVATNRVKAALKQGMQLSVEDALAAFYWDEQKRLHQTLNLGWQRTADQLGFTKEKLITLVQTQAASQRSRHTPAIPESAAFAVLQQGFFLAEQKTMIQWVEKNGFTNVRLQQESEPNPFNGRRNCWMLYADKAEAPSAS